MATQTLPTERPVSVQVDVSCVTADDLTIHHSSHVAWIQLPGVAIFSLREDGVADSRAALNEIARIGTRIVTLAREAADRLDAEVQL